MPGSAKISPEEDRQLRDEEWDALFDLRKRSWASRQECAKGIKQGVVQRVGWELVPAEHCQNRLDRINLRTEMLFQCDWFRAKPPCPFRVKAKEQDDGSWKVDGICPLHALHSLDEVVEAPRPTLKMGNPGPSIAPSAHHNSKNDSGSNSSSQHGRSGKRARSDTPHSPGIESSTGLYRDFSAGALHDSSSYQLHHKGTVKRRRRSSTPPTTAFPYDEKLKKEHTEDSKASNLPKLGQRFKSREAFERACAKGTPEDANWTLVNVGSDTSDAVEKRCRHLPASCTGDNFRVRCELQEDGVWLVVRSIYLHDVGISAVFTDALGEVQGGRTRRSLGGSRSLAPTPASTSPKLARSSSQSSSHSSQKRQQQTQQSKKRSRRPNSPDSGKTSSRPSRPASAASSNKGPSSVSGSEENVSTSLYVQPYVPKSRINSGSSSKSRRPDFLATAVDSFPDIGGGSGDADASTSRHRRLHRSRSSPSDSSHQSHSNLRSTMLFDDDDEDDVEFVDRKPSPITISETSGSTSRPPSQPPEPAPQQRRSHPQTTGSSSQLVLRDNSQSIVVSTFQEEHKATAGPPWQAVTDFLNGLCPPTNTDHGLGDLCGEACYEAGWVKEESFWCFMAIPALFEKKCDEKILPLKSEWETELLKEKVVAWLYVKHQEMLA